MKGKSKPEKYFEKIVILLICLLKFHINKVYSPGHYFQHLVLWSLFSSLSI